MAPDDPKEDKRFLVYSYRTRQPCKARKESMRNNRNWNWGAKGQQQVAGFKKNGQQDKNADGLISMQVLERQNACLDWEHSSMMLLLMWAAF